MVGQYLLFVFLASLGVVQIAAARNGLKGLMLVPGRVPSLVFGWALVVASFLWFFSVEDRDVPGLEGTQLGVYFLIGSSGAVLFSALLSPVQGLWTSSDVSDPAPPGEGLEALRSTSYWGAQSERWRRWRGRR
ncbi:MAG: hypothetical protein HYX89_02335 [Chloroflexi bacterium]|nr:hypothetical protein [Chloroflexota bacterium]